MEGREGGPEVASAATMAVLRDRDRVRFLDVGHYLMDLIRCEAPMSICADHRHFIQELRPGEPDLGTLLDQKRRRAPNEAPRG